MQGFTICGVFPHLETRFMGSKSLVAALAMFGVLVIEQESVQAGFLSANSRTWLVSDMPSADESWFEGGAGSSVSGEEPTDRTAITLNAALSTTMRVPRRGGMSSSAPQLRGSGAAFFAIIEIARPADHPLVTWVCTESRVSLPRRAGSGILRPPRSFAVV